MINLIFDMDGTLVDLYGVESWLERIRNNDSEIFRELELLPWASRTLELLDEIHDKLKNEVSTGIVTWSPIDASREYHNSVALAKLASLENFDSEHVLIKFKCLTYGTPKSLARYDIHLNILFDDNIDVREEFRQHDNCIAFSEKEMNSVLELILMMA